MQKSFKHSQASMEFIILFGIVLIIFVIFMALTADRLKEATEDRDILAMKTLGDNIRNEVVLATQVKEFYIRRFKLPLTINGKPYNLKLEGSPGRDLKIVLNPDAPQDQQKEYVTLLPVEVGGTFFNKIEEDFLDHCIIKKGDGSVKIARNQATINLEAIDNNNDLQIGDGEDVAPQQKTSQEVSIPKDKIFSVTINLDCIDEVEGVQFTIKYDQTKLEFNGEPVENPLSDLSKIWFCEKPEPTTEICNDGLDNDGDSLVDLNDPDCFVEACYRESAYSFSSSETQYKPGDAFELEEVEYGSTPYPKAYTKLVLDSDLTNFYKSQYLSFKKAKEADCIINTMPPTCNPSVPDSKLNLYQGCPCWGDISFGTPNKKEGILTFGFIHRTGMENTAQVAEIQFKTIGNSGDTATIEFLSLTVPGFVEELGGVKRLPETRLPLTITIT